MSEAFVYCWTNLENGCKYIGYHKGSENDGYICSSKNSKFWEDWETHSFSRQIIAHGTVEECSKLEFIILKSIDLKSDEYYNNAVSKNIVMTKEIRKKISDNHADVSGKNNPMYGKRHTQEVKDRISTKKTGKSLGSWKDRGYPKGPRFGHQNSYYQKKRASEANKNKVTSKETKEKISNSLKKKYIIENTIFDGVKSICEHFNLTKRQVHVRLSSDKYPSWNRDGNKSVH